MDFPQPAAPRQAANPQAFGRRPRGLGRAIEAWYQLTAPDPRLGDTSLDGREMVRRGRLASIILLGLLTIWIFYLPVDLASGYGAPTLVVFGVGLLVLSGLLAMNRRGWTSFVALCLIVPIDAGFLAIQLATVAQAGPAERAGSFPILIFSELVAAALLPPAAVFVIAFVNCSVLFLAIMGWPDAARMALFTGSSPSTLYNIVVGAPATQFIIALVMFLFTRSALSALGRADRAERVAEGQRQQEEHQRRELQEGAEHIRQVLVQVSNGNYHARVARVPHPLLWQIGITLNTFVGRLERLETESYILERENQQAQRVAEAIQLVRYGRQPIWPVPSGLPIDVVIVALTQPVNPSATAQAAPLGAHVATPPGHAPGETGLPEWMRGTGQQPWPWEQGEPAPPRPDVWPGEDGSEPR
jgi:hypothetical protein